MIILQIHLRVPEHHRERFESTVRDSFVPALRRQAGYLGATLSRVYPEAQSREINAAAWRFSHQIALRFESETSRRRWVASREHAAAWPPVRELAEDVAHIGYDVVLSDTAGRAFATISETAEDSR